MKTLGAEYFIEDNVVTMQGIGGRRVQAFDRLNCRESGSTLRFFLPVVLTGGEEYEFYGAERLFERPLDIYEDICKAQGIEFTKSKTGTGLPAPVFLYVFTNQSSTISLWVITMSISFSSSLLKKRSSLDSALIRSTGSSSRSRPNTTITIRQTLPS